MLATHEWPVTVATPNDPEYFRLAARLAGARAADPLVGRRLTAGIRADGGEPIRLWAIDTPETHEPFLTANLSYMPGRRGVVWLDQHQAASRLGGALPELVRTQIVDEITAAVDSSRIDVLDFWAPSSAREVNAALDTLEFDDSLVFLSLAKSAESPAEATMLLPGVVEEFGFDSTTAPLFLKIIELSFIDSEDIDPISLARPVQALIDTKRGHAGFAAELWRAYTIDGEPAAVLLMIPTTDSHALTVSYLGVAPAFRRRGIGEALMARADAQTVDDGLLFTTVGVREDNGPARKLYEKLGFVEYQRKHAFYRVVSPELRQKLS